MLKKAFIFIVSCLCTLLIFTNLNNNHVKADTKTYNIGTDVTYPLLNSLIRIINMLE